MSYTTFDEMGLNEDLLRGIYAYGFEKPSIVQQRVICPMIKGNDIIAQAQSGTGKTGTFSIAILERLYLHLHLNKCQAIVVWQVKHIMF